jgi:hypothetical protein
MNEAGKLSGGRTAGNRRRRFVAVALFSLLALPVGTASLTYSSLDTGAISRTVTESIPAPVRAFALRTWEMVREHRSMPVILVDAVYRMLPEGSMPGMPEPGIAGLGMGDPGMGGLGEASGPGNVIGGEVELLQDLLRQRAIEPKSNVQLLPGGLEYNGVLKLREMITPGLGDRGIEHRGETAPQRGESNEVGRAPAESLHVPQSRRLAIVIVPSRSAANGPIAGEAAASPGGPVVVKRRLTVVFRTQTSAAQAGT